MDYCFCAIILTQFYEIFIIKECLFTWQTTNILILFSLHLYYFQTSHFLCYLHRLGIRCHQKKYPELLHRVSLYFWNIFRSFFLSFLHVYMIFPVFCRNLYKVELQTNQKWSSVFKLLEPNFSQWSPTFSKTFFANNLCQHIHFSSAYYFN